MAAVVLNPTHYVEALSRVDGAEPVIVAASLRAVERWWSRLSPADLAVAEDATAAARRWLADPSVGADDALRAMSAGWAHFGAAYPGNLHPVEGWALKAAVSVACCLRWRLLSVEAFDALQAAAVVLDGGDPGLAWAAERAAQLADLRVVSARYPAICRVLPVAA